LEREIWAETKKKLYEQLKKPVLGFTAQLDVKLA
jgi:hypothetical protein